MEASGSVVFSTVGRVSYGFDVFSVPLLSPDAEQRLTDTLSVNFNAQFAHSESDSDSDSVVFVSERSGSPRIFLTRPGLPSPVALPCVPESLFHDRPVLAADSTLYFISGHQPPPRPFRSWAALYSLSLRGSNPIVRLTPPDCADFSPALSRSGKFVAVASYGSAPWAGEFHELDTSIVVFDPSRPHRRLTLAHPGGWPSWCGDHAVYFHRRTAPDQCWSVYRVDFFDRDDVVSPVRVTPPGVHCFTPAALHDGTGVVVATRRRGSYFRHIELFDLGSNEFRPITAELNPEIHHYNPFVSSDSKLVGYHRFRGIGHGVIPNLEPVDSPVKSLRMLRINGSFPSLSPGGELIAFNPDADFMGGNGGLKIMKSDGSKRWTLVSGRTMFCNAWSPAEENTIFASIGPVFESVKATVQIARITFDAGDLTADREDDVPCEVKILTNDETGNNAFPSCSPDGKSVVFRSGRSGHKNLYVVDAANGEFAAGGGSLRQITDGAWIDTMPSWSPRGDLIAFSSNRHKAEDPSVFSVYVIQPDGTGLRRIHVASEEDVDRERINHVCFSNDGEWLLFTANLSGVSAEPVGLPNQFQPYGDLFVVRLDGSGLRRLTWNAYENGTPAWLSGSDDLVLGGGDAECDAEQLLGQFAEPLWINSDSLTA